MSRAKLVVIGLLVLVAIASGIAQYRWKLRRPPFALRDFTATLAAPWRDFARRERRPPRDLAELQAADPSLEAGIAAAEATLGQPLATCLRLVRPTGTTMGNQPLGVYDPALRADGATLVLRVGGAVDLVPAPRATAFWERAGELLHLAEAEDRGISPVEWGAELLE